MKPKQNSPILTETGITHIFILLNIKKMYQLDFAHMFICFILVLMETEDKTFEVTTMTTLNDTVEVITMKG